MDKGESKIMNSNPDLYIGDHNDALPSQSCNLHNGHVFQM